MLCPSPFLRPYWTADRGVTATPAFQGTQVCQQYLQAIFKTSNKSWLLESRACVRCFKLHLVSSGLCICAKSACHKGWSQWCNKGAKPMKTSLTTDMRRGRQKSYLSFQPEYLSSNASLPYRALTKGTKSQVLIFSCGQLACTHTFSLDQHRPACTPHNLQHLQDEPNCLHK